tara:strand:- start:10276 stop:10758 length:483 start_codon:yes stop_codon:yes gene_type:complete
MNSSRFTSHQTKKSFVSILFYLWLTLSASMILYSCSDSGTGTDDNSNGSGNGGGGGSNTIGTAPTFENVGQILAGSCGDCHTSRQESGVRVNTYENLMNSVGVQYGREIVDPGSADTSPLIDKIEPDPQFGVRMPEGGSPLTNARIDQIREWINNGAENN